MIKVIKNLSKKSKIALFLMFFPGMAMCSQAGWMGYYGIQKPDGSWNKVDRNTDNGVVLNFPDKNEMWVEMSKDCSEYFLAGIVTPFTPPIPFIWLRSWAWGGNCDYFTVQTRPSASLKLKLSDSKTHEEEFYEPKVSEAKFGYTKYTFPLKAKNIDSGIIIIEKNGEKIEVPFEYKYQKFWH